MTVFSYTVSSAYMLAAVLVVTTISTTDAGYSRTCRHGYTGYSSGVCGSSLAELVQLVCSSNMFSFSKRSTEVSAPHLDYSGPFLPKQNALAVFQKRGSSQGIVCECCVHQCSLPELAEYCPHTNSKRSSTNDDYRMESRVSGQPISTDIVAKYIKQSDEKRDYIQKMQPYTVDEYVKHILLKNK